MGKPDDLSSVPRTHMMEGRTNFCKLSSDLFTYSKRVCGPPSDPPSEYIKHSKVFSWVALFILDL